MQGYQRTIDNWSSLYEDKAEMTVLEPLIEKSMRVKGYSRIEATERAEKWLAGELGVSSLDSLDFIQEWEAEAIVERTMLPPIWYI